AAHAARPDRHRSRPSPPRPGGRRQHLVLKAAYLGCVEGRSNDTLVFLPAWNEEENLPAVLDELHSELPDVDVLVVDDGSTDGTADVAAARDATVLSFANNLGLPAAIAAGYSHAVEHGYPFCGRVDSD